MCSLKTQARYRDAFQNALLADDESYLLNDVQAHAAMLLLGVFLHWEFLARCHHPISTTICLIAFA